MVFKALSSSSKSSGPLGSLDFSGLNHHLRVDPTIQISPENKGPIFKTKKSNYKSSALQSLSLREQILMQNAHLIEKSNASVRSAILHANIDPVVNHSPHQWQKGLFDKKGYLEILYLNSTLLFIKESQPFLGNFYICNIE